MKTEYSGQNKDSFGHKYKTTLLDVVGNVKCEADQVKEGGQQLVVASGPRSNNAFNNGSGAGSAKRPAKRSPNRKQKLSGRKQINGKRVAQLFASKRVQDELIKCEVMLYSLFVHGFDLWHFICGVTGAEPEKISNGGTI